MKISTRGRYAIRVMLDLAEHNTGEYIPLMDIAKRQEMKNPAMCKKKYRRTNNLYWRYFYDSISSGSAIILLRDC